MTVIIFEKDVRVIFKEMSIVVYVVGWNKSLEVTQPWLGENTADLIIILIILIILIL